MNSRRPSRRDRPRVPSLGRLRSYSSDPGGEALERLRAGNARFVHGKARFPRTCKTVLAALAKQQQPHATILGCSDSRVPPELLFDAGFGDLPVWVLAPVLLWLVVLAEEMGRLFFTGYLV